MIHKNISLKSYNSFGVDCQADNLITISSEKEAEMLFRGTKLSEDLILIIGSGSNLLFLSDFRGTIIHPEIQGINSASSDKDHVFISAGAGTLWDNLVGWSVKNGFGGLENLSLIPGTVGAAPVQNIGAYGVEVHERIESVRAVSLENGTIREFSHDDCRFGYRDSIFKNEYKNKFLISWVTFRLSKKPVLNISYGSISEEILRSGAPTVKTVREAVIKIRRSKLPDPEITGNAGSFFRNPVLKADDAENLQKEYPDIPVYIDPSGGRKLAAGWLIEKCGWKGYRSGDAGVHDKQALVLVNFGKATGREIFELSEKIRLSVSEKFGINLEREVEIVGYPGIRK